MGTVHDIRDKQLNWKVGHGECYSCGAADVSVFREDADISRLQCAACGYFTCVVVHVQCPRKVLHEAGLPCPEG